ncbi:MAG: hypothetical protein IKX51_06145 [Bacteroidales bacterium]|nr:hypothetical protein [Bacteroidales bacterium]
MTKTNFIVTIAVALIAGVSVFVACTKEENKSVKDNNEITSIITDKDLSPDELDELMQNYDTKITIMDSCYYVTIYNYLNCDYCVKSYLDADNTTFAGLCTSNYEGLFSFTRINDNKLRFDFTDFIDSVFITNILFDEDNGKMTFDLKVGVTEYMGNTIYMSETLLSELIGFANGTNTSLSTASCKTLGKTFLNDIFYQAETAFGSAARDCVRNMDRLVRECMRQGGHPNSAHNALHINCFFECN